MKAQSSEKFIDVSDVIVTDEDGYLIRNMTIKTNGKIVPEQIWISPVTSEMTFQSFDLDTDAQLHDERIIAVREEPIQGVQDCACECQRSQAGTGKNTHIEIRDVAFFQRSGEWLNMESRKLVRKLFSTILKCHVSGHNEVLFSMSSGFTLHVNWTSDQTEFVLMSFSTDMSMSL